MIIIHIRYEFNAGTGKGHVKIQKQASTLLQSSAVACGSDSLRCSS